MKSILSTAFLAAALAVAALADERMQVVNPASPVLSRPEPGAPVLGKVNAGDILFAKESRGDWLAVSPPDHIGVWLNKDFVEGARVVAKSIQVRTGPGLEFDIVGNLSRGAPVLPLSEENGWCKISPPSSMTVWMRSADLRPVPSPSAPIRNVEPLPTPSPDAPPPPPPPPAPVTPPVTAPTPVAEPVPQAPVQVAALPAPSAPTTPTAPAPTFPAPKVAPSNPNSRQPAPVQNPAPQPTPPPAPKPAPVATPKPAPVATPNPRPAPHAVAPSTPSAHPAAPLKPRVVSPAPATSRPASSRSASTHISAVATPVAKPAPVATPNPRPAPNAVPPSAPIASPALADDLDLDAARPGQGRAVKVSGEVRNSPLARATPSKMHLIQREDSHPVRAAWLHAAPGLLRAYVGKQVEISGFEYWTLEDPDTPVVVVDSVRPLAP